MSGQGSIALTMRLDIRPSAGVAFWLPRFRELGCGTVLDYGAGKLRNSLFLAQAGFEVVAADRDEVVARWQPIDGIVPISLEEIAVSKRHFDAVVCTYVLNILGDLQRSEALVNLVSLVKPGGLLCIEVWRRPQARYRVEGELLHHPNLQPKALLIAKGLWSALLSRI